MQKISTPKSTKATVNRSHIFKPVIPVSVKAAEASAEGISIFRYYPKNHVAYAYKELTREVLQYED